jgi:hypothetical protein
VGALFESRLRRRVGAPGEGYCGAAHSAIVSIQRDKLGITELILRELALRTIVYFSPADILGRCAGCPREPRRRVKLKGYAGVLSRAVRRQARGQSLVHLRASHLSAQERGVVPQRRGEVLRVLAKTLVGCEYCPREPAGLPGVDGIRRGVHGRHGVDGGNSRPVSCVFLAAEVRRERMEYWHIRQSRYRHGSWCTGLFVIVLSTFTSAKEAAYGCSEDQ